jgi:hypothetical protein
MMKYILSIIAVLILATTGMAYTTSYANMMGTVMEQNGIYGYNIQPLPSSDGYIVAVDSFDDVGFALGVTATAMVMEGVTGNSVVGYITSPGEGTAIILNQYDAATLSLAAQSDDSATMQSMLIRLFASSFEVNF